MRLLKTNGGWQKSEFLMLILMDIIGENVMMCVKVCGCRRIDVIFPKQTKCYWSFFELLL